MAGKQKPKLKIMVASTIYGFEDQLNQICATLKGYGYQVLNSHLKTIPVDPAKSNLDNCLLAVESCDLFFGIVRPQYGSGIIGDISITHEEMRKAIELKKPRWFVAHRDIKIARELLKQYMVTKKRQPRKSFKYKSTNIMDDIRVIQLYNDTILNDILPKERIGHWVDEYFRLDDILQCVETQFADVWRVSEIVEQMRATK
jgi:hypothetical protein